MTLYTITATHEPHHTSADFVLIEIFSPLEQLHLYFFILSASVSGIASSSFLMDTRLKTDLDPESSLIHPPRSGCYP